MGLISYIKSNPKLKKFAHWLLIPTNDHRPRFWIRILINPFKHKRGKQTIIRYRSRLDTFPFNRFELGDRSIIEDFVTINNGVGDIIIGRDSIIGIGSVLIGPVTIGNNVMLAQNIVVSGLNHGYEDPDVPPSRQKDTKKQIVVGDDVWIGANSVVTAGVNIGKHVVIGAGSVVTRDIPGYSVAVGNPAKVIKQYNFSNKKWEKV